MHASKRASKAAILIALAILPILFACEMRAPHTVSLSSKNLSEAAARPAPRKDSPRAHVMEIPGRLGAYSVLVSWDKRLSGEGTLTREGVSDPEEEKEVFKLAQHTNSFKDDELPAGETYLYTLESEGGKKGEVVVSIPRDLEIGPDTEIPPWGRFQRVVFKQGVNARIDRTVIWRAEKITAEHGAKITLIGKPGAERPAFIAETTALDDGHLDVQVEARDGKPPSSTDYFFYFKSASGQPHFLTGNHDATSTCTIFGKKRGENWSAECEALRRQIVEEALTPH